LSRSGIPSAVSGAKKVMCVGGGLGVAPIFPRARAFKENGAYAIGDLGFRKTVNTYEGTHDIHALIFGRARGSRPSRSP